MLPAITVVIVGHNSPVLRQCLLSASIQDFRNYDVVLLDDDSDDQDGIVQLARQILRGRFHRSVTSSGERIGKVALYRKALQFIEPGRFIVNLDSDDYFVRKDALALIAERVAASGAWVVFGRHRDLLGHSATPPDGPEHIKRLLSYPRSIKLWFDHPHCAYARVLSEIPEESITLPDGGGYPRFCQDRFLFQQAMELVGVDRVACLDHVIYEWRFPTKHNTFFNDSAKQRHDATALFEGHPRLEQLPDAFFLEGLR